MAGGRPTDYSDEIVAQARAYLETYEDLGDAIPSVEGMARAINRARSTLYVWAEEENNQFSDILSELKELQAQVLVNKGLKSEFNSTITKLILTKHGYSDKQELTGADGGAIKTDSKLTVEFVDAGTDSE